MSTCPVVLDKMRKDNVRHLNSVQLLYLNLIHTKTQHCDVTLTYESSFITSQSPISPPPLVTPVCAVLSSPLHRRASMLDFYFDHSEERPLEAFEDIFASYESKK